MQKSQNWGLIVNTPLGMIANTLETGAPFEKTTTQKVNEVLGFISRSIRLEDTGSNRSFRILPM